MPFTNNFGIMSLYICVGGESCVSRTALLLTYADNSTNGGANSHPDEYKSSLAFIKASKLLPLLRIELVLVVDC